MTFIGIKPAIGAAESKISELDAEIAAIQGVAARLAERSENLSICFPCSNRNAVAIADMRRVLAPVADSLTRTASRFADLGHEISAVRVQLTDLAVWLAAAEILENRP